MSIILDMPEADYHAHPALSSTGARRLLDCPAKFEYARTHPQKPKPEFDLGHAVHALVLGVGAPTVVIPPLMLGKGGAANTDAAREFVADARANGHTPVKQDVYDHVRGMAESVLANKTALGLLTQEGNPEASVFADDPETGIPLKARFDYLPADEEGVAVDLKSARNASRRGFARAAAEHGYHIQRGQYDDTYAYATGSRLRGFVFVVVEIEPPYLVGIYRLRSTWEELGTEKARAARRIYRECLETDIWPGYGDEIQSLEEPFWLVADEAEVESV